MQDSDPVCPNDLHEKVRDSKAGCRKEGEEGGGGEDAPIGRSSHLKKTVEVNPGLTDARS